MAGMIALIMFLLVQCEAYEINAKECQSNDVMLQCNWRGKANYLVSAVLTQETRILKNDEWIQLVGLAHVFGEPTEGRN